MQSINLCALPVTAHSQSTGRLTDSELMRFESVIDVADHAVQSSMQSRAAKAQTINSESDTDEILISLVKLIGAITDVPDPKPSTLKSKRELLSWAHCAIRDKVARDVHRASQHGAAPGINAATMAKTLELITNLTRLTGGTAYEPRE